MLTLAFSARRYLARVMAGDSRVSPVSFLKANPRMAIFLPVSVLNRQEIMRWRKRFFWCSFISTTCIMLALNSISAETIKAYLTPICRHLRQVQALAQIHQVQNILLKTTASKANARLQELGSDPAIQPASIANLINICTRRFANRRKCVDGGDTLSQHSIGSKLRQLRRPQVHCDNLLPRNPSGIDIGQRSSRRPASWGVEGANQNTVRLDEIGDCSTLSKELRVGKDIEVNAGAGVGFQLLNYS